MRASASTHGLGIAWRAHHNNNNVKAHNAANSKYHRHSTGDFETQAAHVNDGNPMTFYL